MKTTLNDLNDFLFKQLESLSNADLEGDKLREEIDRSKAVTNVAGTIITNASLVLQAKRHADEYDTVKSMPNILSLKNEVPERT